MRMRIEFIHGEYPDVDWSQSRLRIGRASDNTLSLPGKTVAMHHVVLIRDARGWLLEVCAGAARVYVNARPVHEKAILYPGDTLGIGHYRMRLVASWARSDKAMATAARVMALRAVAGAHSGCVFTLDSPLELAVGEEGQRTEWPQLVFTPKKGGLALSAKSWPDTPLLRVNGISMQKTVLHHGDQIVAGAHRFIVDISTEASVRTRPTSFEGAALPAPIHSKATTWLVITALVLALILSGWLIGY